MLHQLLPLAVTALPRTGGTSGGWRQKLSSPSQPKICRNRSTSLVTFVASFFTVINPLLLNVAFMQRSVNIFIFIYGKDLQKNFL